jgi:hypothetical protein
VAYFDFSGGRKMKDNSSCDAGRNGNDSTPAPIRNNAKGKYHQAGQQSDLDQVQRHRLITALTPIQGAVRRALLLRLPRTSSATSANGPKISAVLSHALVDLPRSCAMS